MLFLSVKPLHYREEKDGEAKEAVSNPIGPKRTKIQLQATRNSSDSEDEMDDDDQNSAREELNT